MNAPYVTGLLPREAVTSFLQEIVVPCFWPAATSTASLSLTRARFSPGKECVALATIVREPSKENARIVVTFADNDDLEDAAKDNGKDLSGAMVYSPELGCIAEVFPSDWRLPYLGRVLTPDFMLPEILSCSSLPPMADYVLDVRLLRYRPHSRAVIQYTTKGADGEIAAEAVGKVFRSEGKAKRMWRLLESIHSKTSAAPVIPRPLALLKDSALVLMEKASGRPLPSILSGPDLTTAVEAVRSSAAALRAFHSVEPGDQKVRKPSRNLETVTKLAKRVRAETEAGFDVRGLVRDLERRADILRAPLRPVLTHGTFKPSAVLIDGRRATIVDLDACSSGDAARDVACFSSKLRAMALTPGQEGLAALADEFLASYTGEPLGGELGARVQLYEAIFLAGMGLKHLHTSWQGEEDGTPGLTLLNEARRRLESNS